MDVKHLQIQVRKPFSTAFSFKSLYIKTLYIFPFGNAIVVTVFSMGELVVTHVT